MCTRALPSPARSASAGAARRSGAKIVVCRPGPARRSRVGCTSHQPSRRLAGPILQRRRGGPVGQARPVAAASPCRRGRHSDGTGTSRRPADSDIDIERLPGQPSRITHEVDMRMDAGASPVPPGRSAGSWRLRTSGRFEVGARGELAREGLRNTTRASLSASRGSVPVPTSGSPAKGHERSSGCRCPSGLVSDPASRLPEASTNVLSHRSAISLLRTPSAGPGGSQR